MSFIPRAPALANLEDVLRERLEHLPTIMDAAFRSIITGTTLVSVRDLVVGDTSVTISRNLYSQIRRGQATDPDGAYDKWDMSIVNQFLPTGYDLNRNEYQRVYAFVYTIWTVLEYLNAEPGGLRNAEANHGHSMESVFGTDAPGSSELRALAVLGEENPELQAIKKLAYLAKLLIMLYPQSFGAELGREPTKPKQEGNFDPDLPIPVFWDMGDHAARGDFDEDWIAEQVYLQRTLIAQLRQTSSYQQLVELLGQIGLSGLIDGASPLPDWTTLSEHLRWREAQELHKLVLTASKDVAIVESHHQHVELQPPVRMEVYLDPPGEVYPVEPAAETASTNTAPTTEQMLSPAAEVMQRITSALSDQGLKLSQQWLDRLTHGLDTFSTEKLAKLEGLVKDFEDAAKSFDPSELPYEPYNNILSPHAAIGYLEFLKAQISRQRPINWSESRKDKKRQQITITEQQRAHLSFWRSLAAMFFAITADIPAIQRTIPEEDWNIGSEAVWYGLFDGLIGDFERIDWNIKY